MLFFCYTRLDKKIHLVSIKRQSAKHSAVPLSVAVPLRKTAALRLRSQADAVTGINRPNLLASSFSRRLQGDLRFPPLTALHQPAVLLAAAGKLLVLFNAYYPIFLIIIPRFARLSTFFGGKYGFHPLFKENGDFVFHKVPILFVFQNYRNLFTLSCVSASRLRRSESTQPKGADRRRIPPPARRLA